MGRNRPTLLINVINMCDMGEDITERKGFKNLKGGSFSVSGKKEWVQGGQGSAGAGAGCPGHRHWNCRDTLAPQLPAQVPAAVSAGAGDHTLPYLLTRPLSQILTSYVQSPLCLPALHVFLRYISPAEWAEGWWLQAGLLRGQHRHSLWTLYKLGVQSSTVHSLVMSIPGELAYCHLSVSLQSLKI